MIEELKNTLKKFNQLHLLDFVDELNDEEKNLLINDIQSIDLEKVCKLFDEISSNKEDKSPDENLIEPLSDDVYKSIKCLADEEKNEFRKIGKNYLMIFIEFE